MREVDYTTDPARQAQLLRDFRRGAVPLLATASQLWFDPATMRPHLVATAHLDTRRHPELRALQRKLSASGVAGDVVQAWRFLVGLQAAEQLAQLDAHWQKPMRVSAPIVFDLIKHRDMLETVTMTGVIQLVLDRLPGDPVVMAIAVPVDRDDLRRVLAMTAPLAQERTN